MTTETILTDAEKANFVTDIIDYGTDFVAPLYAVVESIEQAVLQSEQVQAWEKDASLAAEYRKLLEGAAAVLENCADGMEDEGDEIGAHEARSMANVINAAMEKQP